MNQAVSSMFFFSSTNHNNNTYNSMKYAFFFKYICFLQVYNNIYLCTIIIIIIDSTWINTCNATNPLCAHIWVFSFYFLSFELRPNIHRIRDWATPSSLVIRILLFGVVWMCTGVGSVYVLFEWAPVYTPYTYNALIVCVINKSINVYYHFVWYRRTLSIYV